MAEVVLGVASSHTPMVSMGSDQWPEHARMFDSKLPDIDYEARAAAAPPWLKDELTPSVWASKYAAAQTAIATLQEALLKAEPDVVVIVGNDQEEMFLEYTPMIAMVSGDCVHDVPDDLDQLPPPQRSAWWAYHGEKVVEYPVETALSHHLIDVLSDAHFDVAVCTTESTGRSVGHAFTFVRRRLMPDLSVPIVPVMLNTFYPPNQPSARRCIELGEALGNGIGSWPSDARVALVASGGLSHFGVDADLDRRVLRQLEANDFDGLAELGRGVLTSGTSETLSWVCAARALYCSGLKMSTVDYIPAYRSLASTGVGLAFAQWS